MFSLIPRRERGEMIRPYPFDEFRREFSSLFDRAFPAWPFPFESRWENYWGFEMEEKENEYVVRAEVPGFEASELDVRLDGNVLAIRAEHKVEGEAKEAVERPYGRLERTLTLPAGFNPEKVEARYRNGVLEVHLAKAPEAQTRHIEVKA